MLASARFLIAFFALATSGVCRTEDSSSQGSGFWTDLASPVTTPARSVLLGGTAATLALVLLRGQVVDPFQNAVSKHPLFKNEGFWGKLGDHSGMLIPNVAYFGGMLLYSQLAPSDLALDRSVLMIEATLYSVAWSTALKTVVREHRPGGSAQQNSFPSGHTTSVFAFASVVGVEHEWYWAAAAYTLAAFTAFSRINANKHFLHDVVMGATIGASYGLGLHYRKMSKTFPKSGSEDSAVGLSLLPADDLSGAVLSITTRF